MNVVFPDYNEREDFPYFIIVVKKFGGNNTWM